jgi:hypothetical protein
MDKISIADFDVCTSFLIPGGGHVSEQKLKYGKGNFYFSSYGCLSGRVTSRRDDLISLLYILLFLKKGDFEFMGIKTRNFTPNKLARIKKENTKPYLMTMKDASFRELAKEILSLDFSDTPDYEKLRHLLRCIIWSP